MEPQGPNDEDLIRRFYQADEEALKVIFQRYKDGLFNFALRFSGNRADAEDAVSHAFLMVCEKRYTVKPEASFKTWLYAVTRNACLSKIRSRGKFYPLWSSKGDPEERQPIDVIDPQGTPRDQLSQTEISAMVQKAVHKLPREQKEALLLREYHRFSYEEIAQVLSCSIGNVKILIFRARNQLKDLLPPVLLEEGR